MLVLTVDQIGNTYGNKEVLRAVSFVVNAGDRVAIVGPNGSGKSTLLRLLAGAENSDVGQVSIAPRGARAGYLPQGSTEHPDAPAATVLSNLARRQQLEQEVTRLASQLAADTDHTGAVARQYERALEQLSADDGHEPQLKAQLQMWGLGHLKLGRPVGALSGGERTRLRIARLVAQHPDVLLLDEPTNHLDVEGVERLEAWLADFRGALVFASHDRALLAAIATAVVELASAGGQSRHFHGGYTEFLEVKERELAQQRAAYGRQERQVAQLQTQLRRLKQRARRIEGTSTHHHYRKRSARVARQATVLERRLERSLQSKERVEKPQGDAVLQPELRANTRGGDDVLAVEALTLRRGGRTLLQDATFSLRHGERAALMGPNGSGKTTLMQAIVGAVQPSAGSVRLGTGVQAGLLAQEQEDLDLRRNAIETLQPVAAMDESALRRLLHHYLFTTEDVITRASLLSYGQRARLALAKLVLAGTNLLVLDEPTNHLDIPSREAFEAALTGFEGTVLIVSHDRYFVETYATRVLTISEMTVWEYLPGT